MNAFSVFDELFDRYDAWYVEHQDLYLKELKTVPPPIRPSLEVGVGTGRFAAPLGIDVGLDSSIPMLMRAKERGVNCVAGDGTQLPFRDKTFASVYVIFTLCFVENPTALLMEVKRVLRQEGRLILCIIPADSGLGEEYMKKDSPFYGVARFFTIEEVLNYLKVSGYTITRSLSTFLKYGSNDFICLEATPDVAHT